MTQQCLYGVSEKIVTILMVNAFKEISVTLIRPYFPL